MGIRGVSLRGFALRRLSDEALLEHARSGQEAAFAELYRRFHALVYGFTLARLLDIQAAEDVTQETFLRIARSGAPEDVRSARAWVMTVARHAVIDQVRRQKRMPDAVPVDALPDVAGGESAADSALGREDARTVFLALARMRTRYRSALVLREMHGLSSAEIGETMGLKVGAVDTLLCRARDAFGREYAEVSGLPEDCRIAIELIYRRTGTGISDTERRQLSDHLSVCPRCARERGLAEDPRRLAALLPMFGVHVSGGLGLLQRAVEALGIAPASLEALGVVASKVSVAAVTAAVVAAPVVATVARPAAAPRAVYAPIVREAAGALPSASGPMSVSVELTRLVSVSGTDRAIASLPGSLAAGTSSGTGAPLAADGSAGSTTSADHRDVAEDASANAHVNDGRHATVTAAGETQTPAPRRRQRPGVAPSTGTDAPPVAAPPADPAPTDSVSQPDLVPPSADYTQPPSTDVPADDATMTTGG